MAVWYLDNDDEITDAVARLRGADDEHVVFVVPPGSRIATGRMNFKLLAREAENRALHLAIASPDEQVRALAASAGVLAAVTPDEAEAALERGDEAPASTAPPAAPTIVAGEAGNGQTKSESGGGVLMWRSQRLRVTTVVVLIAVIIGGYATLQTVPTAEVTLSPRLALLGPLETTISASAETSTVDPSSSTVPATVITVPLSVQDGYPASGVEATETRATGEVVFSATDQEFDQEIAAGTRVLTPSGIAFQTTETVVLPRGDDSASEIRTPVEALESGESGNVPAEAISIVPSLESQGIGVVNPEPTGGGRFEEVPLVTAADYDAAAVDLRNRLAGALAAYLRDEANTPAGLTVYPETAQLGAVSHDPPADELVGTRAAEFTLGGSVAATVMAVDEANVDQVTRTLLLLSAPAGTEVMVESVAVTHGEGVVDGDRIVFDGTASGSTVQLIDPDELRTKIAGLPVSEAQAILEGLGTATVNVWPGFLGDLPNDRERITLDVLEASTME